MSKILDQDEVDALLRGLSGGEIEAETDVLEDDSGVVVFDLSNQDRIIRGRMPVLEIINDRFARLASNAMYRDIAPLDPEGLLQDEFLNARGAIARFDRSTIEIRVLDTQECPSADLALAAVVVAALKGLVEERWSTYEEQKAWDTRRLAEILALTIQNAGRTLVPQEYAQLFGVYAPSNIPARVIWRRLSLSSLPQLDFDPEWEQALAVMPS